MRRELIYAVIKAASGGDVSIKTLDDRVRLQKVVYLAQEVLKIPLKVSFSMYLLGPYSPDLARLYYDQSFPEKVKEAREELIGVDERRKLAEWWEKGRKWLEVAATATEFCRTMGPERAVKEVSEIKGVSKEFVARVLKDLGLLT